MKKVVVTSTVLIFVVGLFVFLNKTPSESSLAVVPEVQTTEPVSEPSVPVEADQGPIVTSFENVSSGSTEGDWFKESLRLQLVDVAHAYETNIQFPTYSKPLSIADWSLLNPRAFVPTSLPLDGHDGLSAAIVVDQYIVHRDEDLSVRVVVSGSSESVVQTVTIGLGSKSYKQQAQFSSDAEEQGAYVAVIPKGRLSDIEEHEVTLHANISFDSGNEAKVSSVIKLVGTDATLEEVGDAYVDGAHLMIPLSFDVGIDGHYRMQANLFDEESGEPISHISESFKLSSLNYEAELKVHAVTLRAKGYSGPYLLTDINVTRAPANPGDKTGYGATKDETYQVNGFDLDRYSDEEYHDAKNQRRLEFLRRMAGQ